MWGFNAIPRDEVAKQQNNAEHLRTNIHMQPGWPMTWVIGYVTVTLDDTPAFVS
jgi:hypothetical protein